MWKQKLGSTVSTPLCLEWMQPRSFFASNSLIRAETIQQLQGYFVDKQKLDNTGLSHYYTQIFTFCVIHKDDFEMDFRPAGKLTLWRIAFSFLSNNTRQWEGSSSSSWSWVTSCGLQNTSAWRKQIQRPQDCDEKYRSIRRKLWFLWHKQLDSWPTVRNTVAANKDQDHNYC